MFLSGLPNSLEGPEGDTVSAWIQDGTGRNLCCRRGWSWWVPVAPHPGRWTAQHSAPLPSLSPFCKSVLRKAAPFLEAEAQRGLGLHLGSLSVPHWAAQHILDHRHCPKGEHRNRRA